MKNIGLIKYKIVGTNFEKLLNELNSKEIKLVSVKRKVNKISITISNENKKKFEESLRNYEIEQTTNSTLKNLLQLFNRRIFLIVGAVCVFIFSFFFFSHIYFYKINGVSNEHKNEILSELKSQSFSSASRNVNLERMGAELENKFDWLSLVSIVKTGNTLIVNVKEKEYDENLDETLIKPLVAEFDGVVKSVEIYQGTGLVKIGDVIKKGDILVEPYIISNGEKTLIRPRANIIAEVAVNGYSNFDLNEKQYKRSGNKIKSSELSLFGLKFPKKQSQNTFKKYEIEKSIKNVCKNLLIPLKIEVVSYYELTESSEPYDIDYMIEVKKQESLENAYEKLGETFEVKSQKTVTTKVKEKYYFNTYLIVERNIAKIKME